MIPVWAIKIAPYVGAVLLVGGAVWYIDHKGYQRAEQEAEARETERELIQSEMSLEFAEMLREQESRMTTLVNEADQRLLTAFNNIDHTDKTIIQPTLVREIQRETRFSDPAAGISDGMRGAINTARSLSERPCPAGSNAVACFSVSPAPTATGQLDSNPSD